MDMGIGGGEEAIGTHSNRNDGDVISRKPTSSGDSSNGAIYTGGETLPNYIRVTEPFGRLDRPDYGFMISRTEGSFLASNG